ncbi:OmpA family protein [bacterium SCSIO 12696]|nr:OmpA family protein [bacterium SCSIO 12696]
MNNLPLKSQLKLTAAVCLLGVAAACTTVNPYSGEQQTSKAASGAGIGAIAGAVVGAIADDGDRKKGALRGAAAGALLGGGIGYYMDVQEKHLRDRLVGTGVQVQRDGDNIRLIMPSNITFGVDRHDVRSEFYPTLESVALVIDEFDQTNVRVYGHTDSTGSDAHNQVLSERRAQSVGQLLLTQGVAGNRISTFGYGEKYPVASNGTADGRQLNRRVELELQPIEQ